MKMRTLFSLFTASALGLAFVGTAQAGEKMTGSGHNATQNISTETKTLPDGRLMMRIHDAAVIMGNNKGNPFHLSSLDCFSTFIATADGTSGQGSGYCHGLDKDSDAWWIDFSGDFSGGTWSFIGGMGKFEGISGGGTFKSAAQLEGGRSLSTWNGSWEMK